jgi:hypothetical protein
VFWVQWEHGYSCSCSWSVAVLLLLIRSLVTVLQLLIQLASFYATVPHLFVLQLFIQPASYCTTIAYSAGRCYFTFARLVCQCLCCSSSFSRPVVLRLLFRLVGCYAAVTHSVSQLLCYSCLFGRPVAILQLIIRLVSCCAAVAHSVAQLLCYSCLFGWPVAMLCLLILLASCSARLLIQSAVTLLCCSFSCPFALRFLILLASSYAAFVHSISQYYAAVVYSVSQLLYYSWCPVGQLLCCGCFIDWSVACLVYWLLCYSSSFRNWLATYCVVVAHSFGQLLWYDCLFS